MKEYIESAYNHLIKEFGLENVKLSLMDEFESLQKAHDSVHEYIYIAPSFFPFKTAKEVHWHERSAFLLYNLEVFDSAHRSLIEALCGYYNTAFALLRVTLELVLKGAFWECLAHKEFRDDAGIIGRKSGTRIGNSKKTLLDWIRGIIRLKPSVVEDLEKTSGGIYDKLTPLFEDPILRRIIPSVRVITEQLSDWSMLDPIPDPVGVIYDGLYGRLSANVHVTPDMTDVGARLLFKPTEIFSSGELLRDRLSEYASLLHEVIDVGMVVELNIMKRHIEKYEEVKANLREKLSALEELELKYSIKRLKELINTAF